MTYRIARSREAGGQLTDTDTIATFHSLAMAHERMDHERARALLWGYAANGDHNRLTVDTGISQYVFHVVKEGMAR